MICILSENLALKRYLESLLEEAEISVSITKTEAELFVVDLDTVALPNSEKPILTLSGDPFVFSDLSRPFLQERFLALVREKRNPAQNAGTEPTQETKKQASLIWEDGSFYLGGKPLVLTPAEYNLLWILYQNRGKTVPLAVCAGVLGSDAHKGNMPSVYINHLRSKIDYPTKQRMILTVRGEGYMLL